MTRDCPTGWRVAGVGGGEQRREAIVERERGEVTEMGRELGEEGRERDREERPG